MNQSPLGKRPTLEDVADRAGVSRAMASIVLRGAQGARPETREKVLRAAEALNYRKDARASLLASMSRPLLGVVFSRYGLFHLELLDGLYVAADEAGAEVILSALTAHRDEQRAADTLLDFRCDAVIQLGPERDVPVLAGRLPLVVIGWRVDDPAVNVVRSSDELGARQAVDYLVELGHRDIAHVDGGRGHSSAARRRSYRAAMRRHDLQSRSRVITGGSTQERGVAAARELLKTDELPTAVIAYNDEVATGLLETMRVLGVSVPQDVSIVGWDDTSLARLPHVDLTSVRQDANALARAAVTWATTKISGEDVATREVVLPTELVVRGSTGVARPSQVIVQRQSAG